MNTIIENKEFLNIAFCTPEIVVDEITNKLREEIVTINNEFEKLNRNYRKITDEEIGLTEASEDRLITEEQKSELEQRIFRIVDKVGEILPYPQITHQAVVSRALMRKKPFDSKGHNGYRDVLIWETIKEYIRKNRDSGVEIVFLSNNPRDFFNTDKWKSGLKELASDLLQELEELGFDDSKFYCYSSLSEFCNKNVIPLLRDLEDLRPAILEDKFLEKLESAVDDETITSDDIARDVDHDFDSIEISYLGLIQIIQILEMKKISDDTAIIHVECEFEYSADLYIYKMDYISMDEDIGSVTDWNKHYFQKGIDGTVATDLLITYDLGKNQILSVSR